MNDEPHLRYTTQYLRRSMIAMEIEKNISGWMMKPETMEPET